MSGQTPLMSASNSGFRTVVYFVQWAVYGRKYFPADLPIDKLTHVLYAFANVNGETGEVAVPDSWADIEMRYPGEKWDEPGTNVYGITKQLFLLKKRNRNLKVLLSIGGWTYSGTFAAPCSTEKGRQTFARTAVQLLKDRGFDGIDIDWEYPKNQSEGRDLLALLHAVRAELDAYASTLPSKPHLLLTIASPAGAEKYQQMPLGEIGRCLDFFNLMAYDYAGSWDQNAGHQANLYPSRHDPSCTPFSTERAVRDYCAAGVPSDKIVLGMPLYGRAFTNTKGPGKSFQGTGEGSWEQGVWDYKDLPKAGAQEHYDPEIGAVWSYDHNSQTMVTFDNKQSTIQKVDYIKNNHLGGAMWWESSGDKKGGDSLMDLVFNGLQHTQKGMDKSQNELEYPQSKFDNLKHKFP